MKKVLFPLVLLLMVAAPTFAQHGKTLPSSTSTFNKTNLHKKASADKPSSTATPPTGQPRIIWPGKAVVPTAENPFGVATPRPKPMPALQTSTLSQNAEVSILRGENGLPIFFEGKTAASGNASESKPMAERALDYCASLQPQGITQPVEEFVVKTAQTDEQGNTHVRLEQVFKGLPVWGGEVICHTQNGAFLRMNGRYFPTPKLSALVPAIDADAAISKVKTEIGVSNIKTDWSAEELKLIDGQPFAANLIVFHPKQELNGARLVWHVSARPNILSRSEWFVDANTGDVLDQFEHTCNLTGHFHGNVGTVANFKPQAATVGRSPSEMLDGPVNINGADLLGVNRSFTSGGWQVGSQVVLEDASKSMFNSNSSNMPGDPVGVLVTLDGFNTSPENQNFNADLVVSNSTTFTNKQAAISAHYNSEKSFDYYKTKFNRNSIDGEGGNVISIINVSEADGTSMENAFWNGQAMFYGNGGSTFKPLARGLDVGGHEMTHGVVEKTANLIYQDESGALNESFADVFGQMIDGDANDWKIGEDVMQSGGGLPAALRDLSNPHNGQPTNSGFWQPNHTNEQVTGSSDNGGVHVNSGIPNRAFYLFASNAAVGSAKAEQVYYKALKDYLVKSSKFIDCRLAVIQAATDLYGATVANVAADAFTQVGIGNSAGGNYLGQLSPNPGQDFILCTTDNGQNLDLANGTGQVLLQLYSGGVKNRPSVTDDGASFVFVNDEGYVYGGNLTYVSNPPTATVFQLTVDAGWRNAAISKDGRFLALIAEFEEPRIYIVDLADINQTSETFFLYNPTYSQGQITGDVKFADVLEFDYSNQYLMYDSKNNLDGVEYWDISFVQFWENGQFTDGGNAFISKLFTGLPEKVSIGNPTFAKNSPYVIAFDLIDEISTLRNDILGANSETGDYDAIITDNGELGWPNYTRLDNKLMYEKPTASGFNLRLQGLNSNKIQAQGGSSQIVSSHYWGVWFANGTRSLEVGTNEVSAQKFEVKVSPNPSVDFAQLTLQVNDPSGAIITVHNLLGETLMSRMVNLSEGENQLDIDLQHLPSGSYVVRIAAENGAGAAVKLVKQ